MSIFSAFPSPLSFSHLRRNMYDVLGDMDRHMIAMSPGYDLDAFDDYDPFFSGYSVARRPRRAAAIPVQQHEQQQKRRARHHPYYWGLGLDDDLDHILDPRLGLGVVIFPSNTKEPLPSGSASAASSSSTSSDSSSSSASFSSCSSSTTGRGGSVEVKHNASSAASEQQDSSKMVDSSGNAMAVSAWTAPLLLKVDVVEHDTSYEVKCDVPGIDKKDLKLCVSKDGVLSIRGERHRETPSASLSDSSSATATSSTSSSSSASLSATSGATTSEREEKAADTQAASHFRRVERSYGYVQRSFMLPENADLTKVEAKHEAGVLTISIPKLPAKPTTPDTTSIAIQ